MTFYLNGQEINKPKGWDGYTQSIERDFNRRFVMVAYPTTFTMEGGSGYEVLRALFLADICGIAIFEAFDICDGIRYQLVKGNIIITDCEWNLNKCTAEVNLVDDGIGARVENNWRIPIAPEAVVTKNGEALAPVVPIAVEVFDSAGAYLLDPRQCFDWLDCIQHAVLYMTDNLVTVQSAWYQALPDDERVALCLGYQLRVADPGNVDRRVTYTFEKLFREAARRYNLWLAVKRDNFGNPFLVIEPENDVFNATQAFAMPWVDDLVQSVDTEQMFSAVDVGVTDARKNLDLVDPLPFIPLLGFSVERLQFEGVCNIDSILDLRQEWNSDTNSIDSVLGGNDDFDDDVFLIQYDRTTLQAVEGFYFQELAPSLYNEQMLNKSVLSRYSLPSAVGQNYGPVDAQFRASNPAGPYAFQQFAVPPLPFQVLFYSLLNTSIFPDDTNFPNNNAGGAWDPVLNRYTAPVTGFYSFGLQFDLRAQMFESIGTPAVSLNFQARMQRFDAVDTPIGPPSVLNWTSNFADAITVTGSYPFNNGAIGVNMEAGDYVTFEMFAAVARLFAGVAPPVIRVVVGGPNNAIFTTFVPPGGGQVNVDPDAARIITYQFERLVGIADWQQLVNDPTLGVGVSPDGTTPRACHVMKAERNVLKGRTRFTLITNRTQI